MISFRILAGLLMQGNSQINWTWDAALDATGPQRPNQGFLELW